MSGSTPSRPATDRNLLFGILALQMDFITRDALIKAMNAWVLDKAKKLGQILLEQGALRNDTHLLLDALVQKHLEMHGGDLEKSLASVSSLGPVRDELRQIADPDLHASLACVPGKPSLGQEAQGGNNPASGGLAKEEDSWATRPRSVGTTTSSGLRFRVLRPHAKGGLGQVSVAHDEELGREVALKEIQPQHADNENHRSRFLLEAEITGGLEHPGIVPVYGLGTYFDGRPYYAMRFIRGDSLQDTIRCFHDAERASSNPGERAIEFRQLLGRFIDVCNAIAYAHSRGVLHRDLKPGNIMLGQYGETLVVDWGLAKTVGRPEGTNDSAEKTLQPASASSSNPTQMGSAMGTPQYMPPEQAAGRLDLLGPASDVYSLGATLYCLLTGKAPFAGNDVGEVLQKVQRGDFPKPRQVKGGVPAALEAVCLKAMALKPEDRYTSASALAGEIEHWLADEPVAAYREPWAVRAGRWVRRHRTKVTGAVAAVVVAVVCLAVATFLLTAANQREREANEKTARERNEAQRQKGRADRELDEALKQRERADRNLAKVRKVVEDFYTNVAENERLKQADFYELRKKLLETAVPYYEEFVEQKGDDPDMQADRGRAYGRLAFLRSEMGETKQAVADYQQMMSIFAELARLQPDVPIYRQELARTHAWLGILLERSFYGKEAEEAYQKSLAIREKLVKEFDAVASYRQDLARIHNCLSVLFLKQFKLDLSEKECRMALTIQDKLVEGWDNVPEFHQDLAGTLNNLGILLTFRNLRQEAEETYQKSLAIRMKLVEQFDAIPTYRQDLARTNFCLCYLLLQGNRKEEAGEAYKKALSIQEKLVKEFPLVPAYKQ